ncbi:MAG: hypothetical protein QOG04_1397 [Actinomycetota bacterium]|jgi:hypothetical protein|nr:hypothetical protein [Actinomycetota bacterium]
MTERRLGLFLSIGLISLLTLMPVAAGAAEQRAEPALLNLSWWWKQAHQEEQNIGGNVIVVGTSSPFCPSAPGSLGSAPGTCAEGKFPVEIVGGEYDQPEMLSALGFDLSYLTPGSTVSKFEVTLLEAETGCYDGNGDGQCTPGNPTAPGDHVEQTDPVNIDGKKVQACLLPDIFGDVEAAEYVEVPRYQCSGTDPVAERKEIKAVDEGDTDGIDHVWTFDLTPFAQQWAQEFSFSTSIMLVGAKPNAADTGPQDSWRVVFAGPKVEKGIQTELVYEPGEAEGFGPGTTPTDPGTGVTTTTGGTTDFGTGTTDFGVGTDTGTGTTTGVPDPGASPSAAPGSEGLASAPLQPSGTPGYVWLALLAGLIAFAMVRQVVVESTTGIRPNGVLAKIHALNADRRGVAAETTTGSSGIGSTFAGVGRTIAAPFKKLPFFRKG